MAKVNHNTPAPTMSGHDVRADAMPPAHRTPRRGRSWPGREQSRRLGAAACVLSVLLIAVGLLAAGARAGAQRQEMASRQRGTGQLSSRTAQALNDAVNHIGHQVTADTAVLDAALARTGAGTRDPLADPARCRAALGAIPDLGVPGAVLLVLSADGRVDCASRAGLPPQLTYPGLSVADPALTSALTSALAPASTSYLPKDPATGGHAVVASMALSAAPGHALLAAVPTDGLAGLLLAPSTSSDPATAALPGGTVVTDSQARQVVIRSPQMRSELAGDVVAQVESTEDLSGVLHTSDGVARVYARADGPLGWSVYATSQLGDTGGLTPGPAGAVAAGLVGAGVLLLLWAGWWRYLRGSASAAARSSGRLPASEGEGAPGRSTGPESDQGVGSSSPRSRVGPTVSAVQRPGSAPDESGLLDQQTPAGMVLAHLAALLDDAEKAKGRSDQMLLAVLDAVSDPVLLVDGAGQVVHVNAAGLVLLARLGLPADEAAAAVGPADSAQAGAGTVRGRSLDELLLGRRVQDPDIDPSGVAPSPQPERGPWWEALAGQRTVRSRYRLRTSSGGLVHARITAVPIPAPALGPADAVGSTYEVLGTAGPGIAALVSVVDATELVNARRTAEVTGQRLASLVAHTQEVMVVFDPDSRTVTYRSPRAQAHLLATLNHEHPEAAPADDLAMLLPLQVDRLVHPHDVAAWQHAQEQAREQPGQPIPIRLRFGPDSKGAVFAGTLTNRLDDPAVHGWVLAARDITSDHSDLLPAGAPLPGGERRGGDALLIVDPESLIISYHTPHLPYSLEPVEQVGQPLPTTPLAGPEHEDLVGLVEQAAADGQGAVLGPVTLRYSREDGQAVVVDAMASNHAGDPAVAGVVLTLRDVSDRAAAEHALASSERRLAALLGSSNEAAMILVPHVAGATVKSDQNPFSVRYVSPSYRRIVGADQPADGGPVTVHPEDRAQVAAAWWETVQGPEGHHCEFSTRAWHGDGYWMHVHGTLTNHLADEAIAGVVLTLRDVSAQREAEYARTQVSARFQALVQNASDGMSVIDPVTFQVLFETENTIRLLHRPETQAGKPLAWDALGPEDAALVRERLAAAAAAPPGTALAPYRVRFTQPGHEAQVIEITLTNQLEDPAVGGIVANMRDVTASAEAEQRLAASERRFRTLVQNSSDILAILAPREGALAAPEPVDASTSRFDVVYTTPSLPRLLGDPAEEEGAPDNDRLIIHPDDRPALNAAVTRCLGGVDGFQVPVRFRILGTDRWHHLDGVFTRWLDDPAVAGLVVSAWDVSERVRAEEQIRGLNETLSGQVEQLQAARERLREAFRQANAAREDERRQIAHDIHDNPLQSLMVLRWQLEDALEDAVTAGGEGTDVTAPRKHPALAQLDEIAALLRRMITQLRPPILDRGGLIPALEVELAELRQTGVLTELSASLGSYEDRLLPEAVTTLTFRTVRECLRNVRLHSGASKAWVQLRAVGGELRVWVRDDGVGWDGRVPDDYVRAGHIGISSMRETVHLADGTFTLRTAPGAGTVVEFAVPLPPAWECPLRSEADGPAPVPPPD